MSRIVSSSVLAALVLCGAGVVAAVPAQAAEDDMKVVGAAKKQMEAPRAWRGGTETRSVVVSYADLDLADANGMKTLYGRLEIASRRVCSPHEDLRQLSQAAEWKQCYAGALDDAVARVGDGRVAELHRAATGRSVSVQPEFAGTR